MPRINSRLLKGLDDDKQKELIAQYDYAKAVLLKIRREIERTAQEELNKLNAATLTRDLPVEVAGILGRRQGLLDTLTYFPEDNS
jgi:hypothetical protein